MLDCGRLCFWFTCALPLWRLGGVCRMRLVGLLILCCLLIGFRLIVLFLNASFVLCCSAVVLVVWLCSAMCLSVAGACDLLVCCVRLWFDVLCGLCGFGLYWFVILWLVGLGGSSRLVVWGGLLIVAWWYLGLLMFFGVLMFGWVLWIWGGL